MTLDLYATAYSVGGLHAQLDAEQTLFGGVAGDRRAVVVRLLATFTCRVRRLRIRRDAHPALRGSLFSSQRYPWLDRLA